MASEAESARRQAARFLAMAMEAREKGNLALAELLTDAATAAFDKAEEAEAEAAAPPPSTAEPQQPAQQQQQVQPDQEPEDNK
jgi:uncharacterized membrane protein (UPF0182 family)